ncbi:rod shape-determining protein MreC [uncultured Helicobacter sp.]|uniref:rod shape-determining protein MreC n=1 Tax=uncultured Helicobacter sp. TaxID=175537 RepID=UPI00374EBB5C
MRYKTLIFLVLFFVTIIVTMEVNKGFEARVLNVGDKVRLFFISGWDQVWLWYRTHFSQADEIRTLRQKVADYDKILLQNTELINQNTELKSLIHSDLHNEPEFYLARMSAYVQMGQYDKVWLALDSHVRQKLESTQELRILGLVRDNVAFGIAKFEHTRLQGFLNNAKECSYGVFIGKNKAMGIVDNTIKSKNDAYINVSYVPKWTSVEVGDEVYTNGLDGIFIENVLVGKVMEVYEESNFLRVSVLPYAQTQDLGYVWVVDTSISEL